MPEATRLILASGSAARRVLLEAAGLTFDVIPADIDEAAIREALFEKTTGAEGADIASVLAAEKARASRYARRGRGSGAGAGRQDFFKARKHFGSP